MANNKNKNYQPPYKKKKAQKPAPAEELLQAQDVTAAEESAAEAPAENIAPVAGPAENIAPAEQAPAEKAAEQAPAEKAAEQAPAAEAVAEKAAPQEAAAAGKPLKGGSLADKWSRFRLTSFWRIWVSIPFVVIAIAIICFGAYAGQGGAFENGINIGIDFKGGTIITTKLGEDIVQNDYNEYYDIIEGAINDAAIADEVIAYARENEISSSLTQNVVIPNINYTQTSGVGEEMAIVFKIDNISSSFDNEANDITRYRNGLILEKIAADINARFGEKARLSPPDLSVHFPRSRRRDFLLPRRHIPRDELVALAHHIAVLHGGGARKDYHPRHGGLPSGSHRLSRHSRKAAPSRLRAYVRIHARAHFADGSERHPVQLHYPRRQRVAVKGK